MITNKDYLSSIRKCYLFDGIEDEQLTEAIMLLNGRIRKIQKDEFIVRLGDDLQSAGLLLNFCLKAGSKAPFRMKASIR